MLRAFQSKFCRHVLAILTESIPFIAKQTQLVQRESKSFCPEKFLLALLNAVTTGKISLTQIAIQLALLSDQTSLSVQALHERLHRTQLGVESFLVRCLALIVSTKFTSKSTKSPFARILVEDSTQLALHAHNAEELPGHGNHLGSTAGCKIDICFDLLSGQTITLDLYTATTQDRTIGYELLEQIKPNDLILRDMGYFSLEVFASIEAKKAYWLSRLPRGVQANSSEGIALETLLQQSENATIDMPMNIGKEAQHPARLVAQRCSKEESRKSRRELRNAYKTNGKTPSKAQLARCDWHLMVTNIEAEKQTSEQLHELYRQRWQIELAFRGWKKSHQLKNLHKHRTSSTHLKALILAAMILLTLSLSFARQTQQDITTEEQQSLMSMEKHFEYISQIIAKMRTLADILNFTLDPRHICGQKRGRKSLVNQQFELLA
jgi:hypothetical protein